MPLLFEKFGKKYQKGTNIMVSRVRMASFQMQWFKLTGRLWKITKLPMYVVFKKHEIRASGTTKTLHDLKQSLSFRFEATAAERCSNKKNYWQASGQISFTQWNIHKVPRE